MKPFCCSLSITSFFRLLSTTLSHIFMTWLISFIPCSHYSLSPLFLKICNSTFLLHFSGISSVLICETTTSTLQLFYKETTLQKRIHPSSQPASQLLLISNNMCKSCLTLILYCNSGKLLGRRAVQQC